MVRRGFVEAPATAARAAAMVALIQPLCQVERAIDDETVDIRGTRRQDENVPILQRIAAERDAWQRPCCPSRRSATL
jgi:hypothetical protein